jgi:hypothetical protein
MASNVPPQVPTTPPPPPPVAPQQAAPPPIAPGSGPKKKSSVWLWVLLGCLGIIVVTAIAISVLGYLGVRKLKSIGEDAQKNPVITGVELAATFSPEIEVVSKDRSNDTITIRNKKTGETITLNAENFKDGKISWKTDKGEGGEMTFQGSEKEGGGTLKVRSDKGEATFSAGAGAGAPDWVPAYPGSTPAGTFSGATEEGQAGAFNFKTSDSVKDVLAFYKDKLKSEGYEVSSQQWEKDGNLAGGSVNGTKGSTTVGVTVAGEHGETVANVVYRKQK